MAAEAERLSVFAPVIEESTLVAIALQQLRATKRIANASAPFRCSRPAHGARAARRETSRLHNSRMWLPAIASLRFDASTAAPSSWTHAPRVAVAARANEAPFVAAAPTPPAQPFRLHARSSKRYGDPAPPFPLASQCAAPSPPDHRRRGRAPTRTFSRHRV